MSKSTSITFIVPALNEELGLRPTVENILKVSPQFFSQVEIIIYNDGSKDQTGIIAEDLKQNHSNIKVIHHKKPKNIGYIYKDGLKNSDMDYYMMIHGQNDISIKSLEKIFSTRSNLVIPFQENIQERPLLRQIISKIFVRYINVTTNNNLKYYNHYVLIKKSLLDNMQINTNSYAFQAEVVLKLLELGVEYKEVGVIDDFSNKHATKAFKFRNVWGVISFLLRLL